ncbi:MAG: acyl--CoA ligase [Proteobacteria bacterium]|nr:acyl--CoA ligase [Pseudomonadota bacterium]
MFNWLQEKSRQFSDRIYLLDPTRSVTYKENFETIKKIMGRLKSISPQGKVVFIGPGSIEVYQLYFAVTALNAIWIPIDYRFDRDFINEILTKLEPSLVIYDSTFFDLESILPNLSFQNTKLTTIFQNLASQEECIFVEEMSDPIISAYLTSGSTGTCKIVLHRLKATLEHAKATADRYPFTAESRLFNPRHIFHVSGAFPLTTLMECGGCIVIPASTSYENLNGESMNDWADVMFRNNVTHASFFPAEMYAYTRFIARSPELKPPKFQRITTGGEVIEFTDLVSTARVFAENRYLYDFLWWVYPYLGDGILFALFNRVYEVLYNQTVQITTTYGATELICNAIANDSRSGPDPRGSGIALGSLKAIIVDEQGKELPHDGISVGRLEFSGDSIASGYLVPNEEVLHPHFYRTNDLAAISPNGRVTFYGRVDDLITLPGIENKINPVILQREINKTPGIQASIVFAHHNKLHAAIKIMAGANQDTIIQSIKNNSKLSLIATTSFWEVFPHLSGGKTDKKSIMDSIDQGKAPTIVIDSSEQTLNSRMSFCNIF